ncbi:uncharacterized protein LY89DRAFT_727191 [Mollisia scopiformis]|uniref:2EXR domain-containing protein n=1 Tax=Mollisia scopiformis TaxID=149040 RepID=A0A194XVJ8_MOLSC|nr:uncharacterized protein LY89DRAFT_727191 [Mollisia scopiformis]KUJ24156.1 hypothetical protein LY89DRAFT_727191 [Mollisia scopiformis]
MALGHNVKSSSLDLLMEDHCPEELSTPAAAPDASQAAAMIINPNPKDWTESSKSLRRFKCFPKLPIELRLKIWDHALPDEHVIEVLWNETTWSFATDCAIPPALHACSESRTNMLRHYTCLEFNTSMLYEDDEPQADNCIFRTYIDFTTDILYLSYASCALERAGWNFRHFLTQLQEISPDLQHIAFDVLKPVDMVSSKLVKFKKLQTISLVFSDYFPKIGLVWQNPPKQHHQPITSHTLKYEEDLELLRYSPKGAGVDRKIDRNAGGELYRSLRRTLEFKGRMYSQTLIAQRMDKEIVDELKFKAIDVLRERKEFSKYKALQRKGKTVTTG